MTIDQQVLTLINQERSNAGLNPLLLQSQLDSAAERHSQDMAISDFVDLINHTGSDGSSPGERITDAGYQGLQSAENVGVGYTSPEAVVQGWMNSSGHRANILNPNLEHIGVGYYYLENDLGSENWNHYWTVTFGAGGDPPEPPEPPPDIDQQVLNLINQERSNAGLNPLLLQSQLDSAANNHSEDMAVNDFFSHTSSNGTNWSDRISAVYQGSRLAENISAGLATPEAVVQGWMNSSGHRANILNPDLEHIGIGYYHLPNDTGSVNYNYYWTLTFGAGGDPPEPPEPPPDVEPNNTIAQATDTGLSGSGTYNISAEIDPENDVDLFAVQLDAGDRLTADIDAQSIGSSLDPILTVFDSGGTLVAQNDDSDGLDSFIDFTANSAGNYYVGVSSYANSDYNPLVEGSSSGFSSGSYDLSLSICCDGGPDPAQSLDRLTPVDVQVGMLRGPNPQTFSGSVGDTDIVDTYAFSVRDFGPDSIYLANISLTGLSNDADIRLIEDYNSNDIVDSGEVLGSSINGGSLDESIVMGLDGGDYFLQVYQYSGDTNYQLTFA